MAAVLGGASFARAAASAQLNIDIDIKAIANITDLSAVPGASTGTIALSWTEPYHTAGVAPYSYDVRVSSVVQISDDAAFGAAALLSAVSPDAPPAPGPGGGAAGFVVTGLTQDVTYYFAIREKDSTTLRGSWVRALSPPRNVGNFAVATSSRPVPPASGVVTAVSVSSITAAWSVVPGATDYVLVASTNPANPPASIAASSATVSSTATVSGLAPNTTYFLFATACNSGCSTFLALGSTITLAASPAALTATGVSSGTVALAWSANGDPAGTVFAVQRSTDGASFSTIASSTQTAAVVGGLSGASTYYFQVTARNAAGAASGPSNLLTVVTLPPPPAPPSGGIATSVSSTTITEAWTVSPGATGYLLVASTVAALPPLPIGVSSATASSTATVVGLSPNATYFLFASACGYGCSPFAALGSTMTLAAPDLALSTTSISSSTIALAWNVNGNPAGTVQWVQRSTDGATFATVGVTAGAAASFADLTGGVTYYFQVVAVNGAGVASAPSNVLTVLTPAGPTPSTPAGLTAAAGLLRVSLSWTALPPAQQGVGLLYYELERSLNASFGYVAVATTAGTSYVDMPLSAGTTYFYRISARDTALTWSAPSAAVSAVPFSLSPMEPLGVTVAASSTTVTFNWSPTTRFLDGSPFVSTGTPAADELQGYAVYRSTNICDPSYVQLSTVPLTVNSLTDATGGLNYYYRIFSFNSVGQSANTVTLSSLGERDYFVDDCASAMVLDDKTAAALNGASNGAGDVRLLSVRRPQDVGNGVYQSAEWRAYRNGSSELKGYTLPKPARVVLHFDMRNGVPAASTAPVSGFGPQASAVPAGAGASVRDLGVYWNNGVEFKKMYGRVDPVAQTVTVETPNLGIYQIRALARAAGAVFDLSNLSGRVITPNGDGLNDVAIFTYDPGPQNVVPEGKVFDLNGAFVSDMAAGLVPNTLTWNGLMSGRPAHSGVYMYRITGGGKTFTGTIVVAR